MSAAASVLATTVTISVDDKVALVLPMSRHGPDYRISYFVSAPPGSHLCSRSLLGTKINARLIVQSFFFCIYKFMYYLYSTCLLG